ncbi:MAG: FAD-dependent oxidoreductase, partial [Myxococcota bacterium]
MSARVVVVGAGLAGLSAAHRLLGRGLEVVLLERGDRAGGRAETREEKSFHYEPGGHLVSGADTRLLGLVESVGLGTELLPLRPVGLAQAGPRGVRRLDASRPVGLRRTLDVSWRGALRSVRLMRLLRRFAEALDPSAPERAASQDDRSVADFARLYFGRGALERWIGPWVAEYAGGDPEQTSRVLALQLLAHRRFPSWGTLRGDLVRVCDALAGRLPVRFGEEVVAVEPRASGLAVHQVRGGARNVSEADAVVLALPARETRRLASGLLSSAESELLGSAAELDAVCLAVGLESPLTHFASRVRVSRELASPLTALSLEPGVPGGRVPEGRGLAVLVAGGASAKLLETDDERIASEFIADLDRMLPG